MTLPKSLIDELRNRQVHVDMLDTDTLMLRRVPIRSDAFNKTTTNLLVKRPAPGMPYLALVDESLSYIGGDPEIRTAFPGTTGQRGWRALAMNIPTDRDAAHVLQSALRILGFDGITVPRLLERFGRPMRDLPVHSMTIGRDGEVTEIIAALRRREPTMPLVVGGAGSGKTNLLHAVKRRLAELHSKEELIEIDLLDLFSVTSGINRTRCVVELLAEIAAARAIVVIEHAELLIDLTDLGHLILASAVDAGAKIIGTVLPEAVESFNWPQLVRRLQVVTMAELPRENLLEILLNVRTGYGIEISESIAAICVKVARELPGHFPGKATGLLDSAASLAMATGAPVVAPDDIYNAAQKYLPAAKPQTDDDAS